MLRWNCAILLGFLIGLCGAVSATEPSFEARDAWLMKNYRFTGPPKPGEVKVTDPVVADLQSIQSLIEGIMRRARLDEDYGTALAAASQAAANAQIIGNIQARLKAAASAKAAAEEAKATPPLYWIALKDHAITAATAYWIDGSMLNYIDRNGAHVQVRMDLVDRRVTIELNRAQGVDFHLPE
jgi:hypothetical protein